MKRWNVILDLIDPDQPTNGAEIGVRRAETSSRILKARPKTRMILVDPWKEYNTADEDRLIGPRLIGQDTCEVRYLSAMRAIAPYVDRATVLRVESLVAADLVHTDSLDYVFIDGLHTYEACMADCLAWFEKLKPGGWLIVHDYCEEFPAVTRATNIFCKAVKVEGELRADDCYIVKKPCN